MRTILPYNSAIIIAENEQELHQIFSNISARNCNEINEIGYISGGNGHQFYIQERNNIMIVRYTGIVDESTEEIISAFYAANGFNW